MTPPNEDVLSAVLNKIRLSGSVHFCFLPSGAWQTDAAPSLTALSATDAIPFHIVVDGACWLKMGSREITLAGGDVVAFPFGGAHQLGFGRDGRLITPVGDLPPKPWRKIPTLAYGDMGDPVRLLCGFLRFGAAGFWPLRETMPEILILRTGDRNDLSWLRAVIAQMGTEVDAPGPGSTSILERLSEIVFIELLRQQVLSENATPTGWIAAMSDPFLGRCLSAIHANPNAEWSVMSMAALAGLSRSALSGRFETMVGVAPMRYVRDWRLCLASVELATTDRTIAEIAFAARYGTEAAFNRAFVRAYGAPPAEWRKRSRKSRAN